MKSYFFEMTCLQFISMSKQKFFTPLLNRKGRQNSYGSGKKQEEGEIAATELPRARQYDLNPTSIVSQKIKSNPSFSLDKMSTRTIEIAKSSFAPSYRKKDLVKLPSIKFRSNPEEINGQNSPQRSKSSLAFSKAYYVSSLQRCLKKHQTNYLMNLYRQHFFQCVQVLRSGKSIKIPNPRKHIKLPKKDPSQKTIFLDLDQTLIHCDENSNNYTVKLNFPLERGGTLAAGVRIRPFCREFLEQLSSFAQIIIFTASSASYADVVLDHLDPQKKWISHRLYRQHCTMENGYYLKDLRVVNRKLEDAVLVDNSPYCHILQPQNGVPIIPFYHYARDRQLQVLLDFLKELVEAEDMRKVVLNTFCWDKFIEEGGEPRKLFFKYCAKQ